MERIYWIVITDLDGTLLDHFTYAIKPADIALKKLSDLQIPVILCSSKTRLELAEISRKTGLITPFVIENGAEIVFPDSTEKNIILGINREKIITSLLEMAEELDIAIQGFSSFTPEKLSELTGLTVPQAKMALSREYSEPFIVAEDSEEIRKEMTAWCNRHDLRLLKGGRFYHLQGMHDKGMAVDRIKDLYMDKGEIKRLKTVVLGDSENDFDMLDRADFPVLIKRHDGTYAERYTSKRVYHSEGTGPYGWKEAIEHIILKKI